MVIRTNGGVITDQMLTGNLRFFKLSSAALGYFADTVSNGGTVIPGAAAGANPGAPAALFQLIVGQDETDYAASFVAGTGYSLGDVLVMSDGALVRVDAPAGPAPITEFTVIGSSHTGQVTTAVRTTTTGNGDFTMTPSASEEAPFINDFYLANGQPVPNSVADRIFQEISSKATIVMINQIDDDNIHFACDDSGFGWDTPAAGDAAAEMLVAIKDLGVAGVIGGGTPLSNNPPVPDNTQTGVPTRDLDVGGVTLTETTPFELT